MIHMGQWRVEGCCRWVIGNEWPHALYCELVSCVHTQGKDGPCRMLEINFLDFDKVNCVDRSKLWIWKASSRRWRGHAMMWVLWL